MSGGIRDSPMALVETSLCAVPKAVATLSACALPIASALALAEAPGLQKMQIAVAVAIGMLM